MCIIYIPPLARAAPTYTVGHHRQPTSRDIVVRALLPTTGDTVPLLYTAYPTTPPPHYTHHTVTTPTARIFL